jgi:hypothetical protein
MLMPGSPAMENGSVSVPDSTLSSTCSGWKFDKAFTNGRNDSTKSSRPVGSYTASVAGRVVSATSAY